MLFVVGLIQRSKLNDKCYKMKNPFKKMTSKRCIKYLEIQFDDERIVGFNKNANAMWEMFRKCKFANG